MTVPAAHKIKCCNSLQRQEQSAGEKFPLVVAVPMEGIIGEKKAREQEDAHPLCGGAGLFRERQHGECADYCERGGGT